MTKVIGDNIVDFRQDLFPAKEEIYSWICDLAQWGHRKTGTEEGRISAEYIAGKLREFGMEDVAIEKVPSMCMFCEDYSLNIAGKDYEIFYANGTNRGAESGEFTFGYDDVEQEFIFLGDGEEADFDGVDVEGKIVVCSVRFKESKPLDRAGWFESSEVYDPDGSMTRVEGSLPDIYSPNNWPYNYFRALQKGAAAFVGILEDYMDDPYWYCEDYTEIGNSLGIEYMSLPALWVSRSSGRDIKRKLRGGGVVGEMRMRSIYKYCDALNVRGVLPGMSDDIILVHSHHDAVFDGAVQDASGVSEMLALGKYFSQLDRSQRQKTMMFAATDTHYTDYMGHQGFIRAREAAGDNIILDLAIEHIGKEAVVDAEGHLQLTGQHESRLVYITKESGLYEFVKETFRKYGLTRTIFAPVDQVTEQDAEYVFRQDEVISDAYYFSESGIPVISTVAGEIYIFHPSDTVDKVAVDQLEPVGKAYAEIALKAAEVL